MDQIMTLFSPLGNSEREGGLNWCIPKTGASFNEDLTQ